MKYKKWYCNVTKQKYAVGNRFAIMLTDSTDGEPIAIATVNIPGEYMTENEAAIKDYSENDGMLEALMNAGIVKKVNRYVSFGYAIIPICEIDWSKVGGKNG